MKKFSFYIIIFLLSLIFLFGSCGDRDLATEPIDSVALLYPENGSIVTEKLKLDWEDRGLMIAYHIEVYKEEDTDFDNPIIDFIEHGNSYYYVEKDLQDKKYFWRVRGMDNNGNWSDWTEMWSFDLQANPLILISETNIFAQTYDVNVVDDVAYVAAGGYGAVILDVKDRANPEIIRTQNLDMNCYDTQIVDCNPDIFGASKILYAGNGRYGVNAYNAVDMEDTLIYLATGGPNQVPYVQDLELLKVNDDLHYIISANSSSGIRVLKLYYYETIGIHEIGLTKHIYASVLGGNAQGLAATEEALYVTCGVGGLRRVDISDENPENWKVDGVFNTYGDMQKIFLQDDYIYAADGNFGFDIIDAEKLELVSNINTAGYARDIHIVGDLAYLADGSRGLRVIDIEDKANPRIIASFDIDHGYAYGVFADEDYAYIADKYRGLLIIGWR